MNVSAENQKTIPNINCSNCKQLVLKSNFCMKCGYEFITHSKMGIEVNT